MLGKELTAGRLERSLGCVREEVSLVVGTPSVSELSITTVALAAAMALSTHA